MGDEYDRAEAEYWSGDYGIPRSHYELMPSISINRGGIQFPLQTTSPTVSGALDIVKTFETSYPSFHEWAIAKENPVRATEDILAEAKAMRAEADRLERIASEREKYGVDPFKNGTVLKVDMRYRTGNRSYSYAVIKAGNRYYLSGRMSGDTITAAGEVSRGMTWDNFVAWLAQGDATVWRARQLERVL